MNFRKTAYLIPSVYVIYLLIFSVLHQSVITEMSVSTKENESLSSLVETYNTYTIFIYFIAILLLVFEIIFVQHPTMKLFGGLVDSLEKLSQGDTTVQINPEILKLDNEWGDLARAFDKSFLTLKLMMKDKKT